MLSVLYFIVIKGRKRRGVRRTRFNVCFMKVSLRTTWRKDREGNRK